MTHNPSGIDPIMERNRAERAEEEGRSKSKRIKRPEAIIELAKNVKEAYLDGYAAGVQAERERVRGEVEKWRVEMIQAAIELEAKDPMYGSHARRDVRAYGRVLDLLDPRPGDAVQSPQPEPSEPATVSVHDPCPKCGGELDYEADSEGIRCWCTNGDCLWRSKPGTKVTM